MKRIISLLLLISMLFASTMVTFADETGKIKEDSEKLAKQRYMQALKNLEKSQDFTAEEKVKIKEFIEANYKNQIKNKADVTPSVIVVPGLPDTSVTTYTKIASYGKTLSSADIWYKNGYICMIGSALALPLTTFSVSAASAQAALYSAGIAIPFVVDNTLNPILKSGQYSSTDKYFKWTNPSLYEYAIKYNYKVTYTDPKGVKAIWAQGTEYTYGSLYED